jgi:hypothetical protein
MVYQATDRIGVCAVSCYFFFVRKGNMILICIDMLFHCVH